MENFMKNNVKVTLYLPKDLINRLKTSSSKRGISMTEAILLALETELHLNSEESRGSKILIEKAPGNIVQLFRGNCS